MLLQIYANPLPSAAGFACRDTSVPDVDAVVQVTTSLSPGAMSPRLQMSLWL